MTGIRRHLLTLTLLFSTGLLSGCAGLDAGRDMISGLSDYIFGDDDTSDPPAILDEHFNAELQVDKIWSHSIGEGSSGQFMKLIPAAAAGTTYAADHTGLIQARNSATGDLLWETKSGLPFSAGPGLGVHSIILGTSHAEVVAYDKVSGERKWNTEVSSEVLAVPVVSHGMVFIRTTDGKIKALNESTGAQIWSVEQSVPALSIRGTSNPLALDDMLVAGNANGKLTALQIHDGKTLWESTIVIPTGRSEIERLVDLDADPIERRGAIFVAGYQGGAASVAETDGDVIWRNEALSSHTGLSTDLRYLYVSDTHGEVSQVDQRNGAALWKQKDLHNRKLTAATVYESYVVVGDFEGWVHWLSVNDGRLLARHQVTKSPIEAAPVVIDGTVFIYAKDGTLAALRVH